MRKFRLALEEEEDIINTLYNDAKAKGKIDGTSDWDDEYPNRDIIREDLKNKNLYVLELDLNIIATISILNEEIEELKSLNWNRVKSCFLVRLCVASEYQGKGIGEEMMGYVINHAKQSGFKSTHHLAAEENKAALRLYDRMGYRNLGEIHVFGTDFIAYEMML